MSQRIEKGIRKLKGLAREARFASAARGLPLTPNERRLLSLKGRHEGRRVFVIGNGPSLRDTDLRLLRDEVTIGCNGIFLIYGEMGFKPTYYTVEDTLVAEDRADEINRMRGTTKVLPYDLRYCLDADEDTVSVNFLRGYPGFPKFSGRFERRAYWGGTVTMLNLQLAFYLGASEVYLVGLDHNYAPPAGADEVKGFVVKSNTEDRNHFHPDYFGPGYRYHDPKVDRMEAAYIVAREFLRDRGIPVLNSTVGGRLDVFPRVEYGSLFS